MDSVRGKRQPGRQDADPNSFPIQRHDSGLSEGEGNDIFEDARETWESEAAPSPAPISSRHDTRQPVSRTLNLAYPVPHRRGYYEDNAVPPKTNQPTETQVQSSGGDYYHDMYNSKDTKRESGDRLGKFIKPQARLGSGQERSTAGVNAAGRQGMQLPSHNILRKPISRPENDREEVSYQDRGPVSEQRQRSASLTLSNSVTTSDGQQSAPPSPPDPATSTTGYTNTRYDRECEMCKGHVREIWYCNVCKFSFCNPCWESQFIHRQSSRSRRGDVPHEKTDPMIAEKVHKVMFPPVDEWAREQLYRDDEITSWFGVERPNDSGPPMFQDYGRFSELMTSTDPIRNNQGDTFVENERSLGRDNRTPSLVSFVGQTGAGKSTLVKLLIDFALQDAESYSSPVVGPPGAHLPTSEDVHLYMDPRTADSQGPLLYADCEGLEGGEREPLGVKFRRKRQKDAGAKEKALKDEKVISERELRWANGPLERSREFAVTNLYPRLLYTFSDVIVVVEHVFERLITWAAAAIETSSNQPVLPHAVIVLNASEHDIDERLWDVPANTESILEDLSRTVNRNETFKKWAQFWRERNKPINTLLDLVLCYYSSVQILRIPQEGRPKLMQAQIEKLYKGTVTACVAARCARNRLRMLLDVEDLQSYLQDAFSHYASTLNSPFDFVQASFRNSPIPPDFGGNILKLALNVMDILQARSNTLIDARGIFSELSYMIASSIMLDNARHKTKGNALKIFTNYMNHLDDALENFCDHHWPCEFVHLKGQRCVNVRVGHQSKGHQSKDGRVLAAGDYVSSFSFNTYYKDFRNKVYSCLVALLEELAPRVQRGETEEAAAAFIHREMVVTNFFLHTATAGDHRSAHEGFLHSHTACFCCLFGLAELQLPCGHVICESCLTMYGKPEGDTDYILDSCPIEGPTRLRVMPWRIRLKPKSAGIRVMTLDGGGIRGIVELEVMKHIETALGGLPIQCFFDLIVGTSTGGLIALGLTSMNWTVDECIERFEKLCDQAFTKRPGGSLPIFGALVENYHHSKYQTTTLLDALKAAFPEDIHLFGGQRPAEICASSVKVAVTTTSLAGNKTYLLSNYNRPENIRGPSSYNFQRPERIDNELKIWEAARATSAAPRYFKSFHHEASQKTYIDGAIHHNNPCRVADAERKLLWPDIDTPDVFLSIGSGSSITLERQNSERMTAAKRGKVFHALDLFKILRMNMETALDCDRIWDDYFASVDTNMQSSRSRFHRISPRLEGEVPALDQKDKMREVRRSTRAALLKDPAIGRVAQQLLASVFYFQLSSIQDYEDNSYIVQGKLMCRLLQPSYQVRDLGKHLHQKMREHGELSFVIWEQSGHSRVDRQPLSYKVIEKMIREQKFEMNRFIFKIRSKVLPTSINLCFGDMTMSPISGFPRSFLTDASHDNNNNGSTRNSQTTTPMFPNNGGFDAVTRASSRYTHGSRRLKRTAAWEPPELKEHLSLSDLRRYGDPGRFIGSDVVGSRQSQHARGSTHEAPLPVPPAQQSPTEPPPAAGQASTRATLLNAFRALLWPIRANPPRSDAETPGQGGVEIIFHSAKPSGDVGAWAEDGGERNEVSLDDSSDEESLTTQYYHVDSAEHEIYKQWVGLLGPSMGRWAPLDASVPGPKSRPRTPPFAHELPVEKVYIELPADSGLAVELDSTAIEGPIDVAN